MNHGIRQAKGRNVRFWQRVSLCLFTVWTCSLFWAVMATFPGSIQAGEGEQNNATQAKQLQLEGTTLQLRGDIEGAIKKYKESLAILPNERLASLLNQLQKNGDFGQGGQDSSLITKNLTHSGDVELQNRREQIPAIAPEKTDGIKNSVLSSKELGTSLSDDGLSRELAKKLLEEKLPEYGQEDVYSGSVVISTNSWRVGADVEKSDSYFNTSLDASKNAYKVQPAPIYEHLKERGVWSIDVIDTDGDDKLISVKMNSDIKENYVKKTTSGNCLYKNNKISFEKNLTQLILLSINKITGITATAEIDGVKKKFIEFLVDVTPTPFTQNDLPDFLNNSPVMFKAEAVLYDDGWRLSENKIAPLDQWDEYVNKENRKK